MKSLEKEIDLYKELFKIVAQLTILVFSATVTVLYTKGLNDWVLVGFITGVFLLLIAGIIWV
jgi:hypothetical protein